MRVVTYNIHKGKGASVRDQHRAHDIGLALAAYDIDLLLCQEVFHNVRRDVAQSDELAALTGLSAYYGANRYRRIGDHGNATFTHYPVVFIENHDVSINSLERRGVLYTSLDVGGRALHVLNVHLSLTNRQRNLQTDRIAELLTKTVADGEAVILAGDFNDWRQHLESVIVDDMGFTNSFALHQRPEALTWHSRHPLFNIDRIYVRNLKVQNAQKLDGDPWRNLSDHLPLVVDFDYD